MRKLRVIEITELIRDVGNTQVWISLIVYVVFVVLFNQTPHATGIISLYEMYVLMCCNILLPV